MRNLLLFLLALASFGTLHAQSRRDSIAVYGKVIDSFTHEMLKGVQVDILLPDSTVLSQHNTNDTRDPGISGNWNANGSAFGRTEMQTADFEFLVKGNKNQWKYVGYAKIYHQNTFNQSISSSETFQPTLPNSTFNRARREAEGNHFKVQTEQAYEKKRDEGFFYAFGALYYQHHRSDALHQGTEFSAEPKDDYRAASLDSSFLSSSDRLANHSKSWVTNIEHTNLAVHH